MASSGTVPTASNFADLLLSYVVDARRGLTAPENAKSRTGRAKETDSVITSTGAVVTNAVKRTSTGRSSLSQTKDLESELKSLFLLE